jgi:CTP synthase
MEEQKKIRGLGGTMRLGAQPCRVAAGTKAEAAYRQPVVSERHRHRFEFNNRFRGELAAKGMVFAGISAEGDLVEIVELSDSPWFVACQFHPEFQSTPLKAHPLFRDFVAAALKRRRD